MRTLAPLLCWPLIAPTAALAQAPPRDTGADRWVATDALGRRLPGAAECGPPRAGRSVAIFYFLWLDGAVSRANGGPFDLSKILAGDPPAPAFGPPGAFHWWGEPRLGHYLGDDPYVLRKHAQMLADAGVDAVAFDVTNGPTYDHNLLALCRAWDEVRADGGRTPRVFFLANAGAPAVTRGLYDRFYAKGLHRDLWFTWRGRPLLLAPPEGLAPEVAGFFEVRHSWAWSDPGGWFKDGRDKWPWLDASPQRAGWHDDPGRPEEVPVAVAGHPVSNLGRSHSRGVQPAPERAETDAGVYFAEQWRRAREVDPELVFVTGWNEWIAQRFVVAKDGDVAFLGRPARAGQTIFVDQYSREFSRDVEPMRGGHGDNYYLQLVSEIRRYKGVRAPLRASAPATIRPGGDLDRWAAVGPEWADDLGDATRRDHPGWGPAATARRHVDDSGRNDIASSRVARDGENVYALARTRAPLTPPAGADWMRLWIDADCDASTGRRGFDYAVNRSIAGDRATVDRFEAGAWRAVAEATVAIRGDAIELAIPRAAIGLDAARGPLRFDYQWTDAVPDTDDPLDALDHGDAAPNGRARYRFEE